MKNIMFTIFHFLFSTHSRIGYIYIFYVCVQIESYIKTKSQQCIKAFAYIIIIQFRREDGGMRSAYTQNSCITTLTSYTYSKINIPASNMVNY